MEVSLIAYTPEPERTVAAAARLCYSADDPQQLHQGMDQPRIDGLVKKLVAMGHTSPLEHASFTFAISGISRAASHQLVRHRIASYSQRSQRYVREDAFDFVIPPKIERNPAAKERFLQTMGVLQEAYQQLAEQVPAEDARYLLPNACMTAIVCTFNTRSLYNFFEHRLCVRAQWEIRQMADKMLQCVRKVAPLLFNGIGAPCESMGFCPEGEMSCGKVKTIVMIREEIK